MARKCSIITVGATNCRPMTRKEFKNLKKGDKVMTYMGEEGIFIDSKNFLSRLEIKSKHFSCRFYYISELVVKL